MDQSAPNTQPAGQPQPPITPTETKKNQTKTVVGIVTAIVVLLFIGVVLIKGFPTTITKPKISLTPSPTPIAFPCPSVVSFCSNPQEVLKEGKSIGIGNSLPASSPAYAIFDGTIITRSVTFASKDGDQTVYNIRLTRNDSLVNAEYILGKQIPGKASAKKGEIIGYTTDAIQYYDKHTLIFSLFDDKGRVLRDSMVFQK